MESDIDKEEINSEIEPEDLQQKLDDGWKLVDVREDDEWMYGHHSEAQHIKMGDITDKLNLFEKNEKYVIVCRSGQRSGKVSEFLQTKDIISYNLVGGMKKLSNFSTEIISSNGNPGTII